MSFIQTKLALAVAVGLFTASASLPLLADETKAKAEVKSTDSKESKESKEDKKPEWDVLNPPGERKSITIDTTETTWSNLDVSADGKTIVFDMLGDLYTMPISGGEAKALTSDMAWNS
ncbi:MAG: hypothetical protein MJK04_35220, partial [Psychrosphaera sp.]|nr:hypothetical protein [Psychrosphaera sp.]